MGEKEHNMRCWHERQSHNSTGVRRTQPTGPRTEQQPENRTGHETQESRRAQIQARIFAAVLLPRTKASSGLPREPRRLEAGGERCAAAEGAAAQCRRRCWSAGREDGGAGEGERIRGGGDSWREPGGEAQAGSSSNWWWWGGGGVGWLRRASVAAGGGLVIAGEKHRGTGGPTGGGVVFVIYYRLVFFILPLSLPFWKLCGILILNESIDKRERERECVCVCDGLMASERGHMVSLSMGMESCARAGFRGQSARISWLDPFDLFTWSLFEWRRYKDFFRKKNVNVIFSSRQQQSSS